MSRAEAADRLVVILDAGTELDPAPFEAVGLRAVEPSLSTPKGRTHAHAH